jgi:cytochrome P450
MSARVNLLEPAVRDNPYPHYAEMRRNAPVCQVDPGGFWVVTRYDDVVSVLKNPQLFSSEGLKSGSEQGWLANNPLGDSMIMMDPPKHGRMRALVNRAFSAQALARLEPRIQAVADQLTAQVLQRRTVDFIEDFALPLPASVIALLLGLDLSLTKHFKRWSDDMVSAPAIASTDTERQAQVVTSVREMEHHLKQVLAERRRNPGDDMVSDLLRTQVDGESLTDRELMGFFFLLLVAGLETTVHLLGHTARVLAERPEVLARVRAEPALIPRLVEEVLRYEPPTHATMRLVMDDVTLGGVKLVPGHAPHRDDGLGLPGRGLCSQRGALLTGADHADQHDLWPWGPLLPGRPPGTARGEAGPGDAAASVRRLPCNGPRAVEPVLDGARACLPAHGAHPRLTEVSGLLQTFPRVLGSALTTVRGRRRGLGGVREG